MNLASFLVDDRTVRQATSSEACAEANNGLNACGSREDAQAARSMRDTLRHELRNHRFAHLGTAKSGKAARRQTVTNPTSLRSSCYLIALSTECDRTRRTHPEATLMPNDPVPPNLPTHILVIEDDADTRCNLIDILQLDGFQVLAVPSFAAAQREADWSAYFAIVLDRKLPDGNSETFLPQLRQLAPDAAVVIVTGYEELTGAIAALRNGASDYLIKPVDADTLRARLRQLAAKRHAELELKVANARMLQAERLAAIGQMMTGLVHESRNALQRSEACLEMLSLNLQGQADSLELVARVQKAQKKLHELFEEVRNYAAPIKLQRTNHDLRDVLEETWDNLVWSRQGRKVSFVLPKTETSPHCAVDASRLEQVFRNILENSLAACVDPVRIEVTWIPTTLNGRPAWQLNFTDNGPGLTSEQRAKIFEPFFTTKPTGTGLGMAISQRIIQEHDGTIALGDSRHEGLEIVITLPTATV